MSSPIIWVEGIIGAGKSTLTTSICESLHLRPIMEPVKTNPYLELFYGDPKRWAFPMQIELLHRRYAMQKLAAYEATTEGGYQGACLDRGLPGDRVFAKLHMLAGNMSKMEWETYERAYNIMSCSLIPPSLLIYLDVEPEIALERIKNRNRGMEVSIDIEYLRSLRKGYYDLLIEINSGNHAWSRGMTTSTIPWNIDHQDPQKIIDLIQHHCKL